MKYQLIEEYFETSLFQRTVQDYFDTVLGKIIAENTTLSAKGLFIINGEVKRDFYDMPYHIHILNGLIPALFVYEKYLQQKGWTENPQTELYLKIFILGFTFHDANKLLGTKSTRERGDLEIAVADLDNHVNRWSVTDFLTDFETHKSTVYYLALATEDRTEVYAADYPITVNRRKHIKIVQRELCHLADGLASIQNEQLESIEALYKAVNRSLSKISKIIDLPISYLKVRQNPYTLLSQNLLQVARKQLYQSGKKVFYATREGFIFWGEDITNEEFETIEKVYLKGSAEDIDELKSTDISAQKCNFGFLGSLSFSNNILENIISALGDKFLGLSPNSRAKIKDFDALFKLTKKMIEIYQIPIDYDDDPDKITLRFFNSDALDEDELIFKQIYCLHKIQWLNPKKSKLWKKDWEKWMKKNDNSFEPITFQNADLKVSIQSASQLFNFINERVNLKYPTHKTYLNFLKTYEVIQKSDDIEEYVEGLKKDIISTFEPNESENDNVKQELFDKYFECKGNINIQFLKSYNPIIPTKKEMCAFTGSRTKIPYENSIAFAMGANAFNNRTVTSLNNTGKGTSNISKLFREENNLRKSNFSNTKSDLIAFYDFFETNLSISKEIIKSTLKSKNKDWLKDGKVEFEKNVSFEYDLGFQLTKIKTSKKITFVEGTFWFVRDHIRLLKELGVRSFVTNIGANYQPHKEAFHFNNSPLFLKNLGWDKVRLGQENEVLDEMSLMWNFGKKRLTNTILKVSQNRNAYFKLYYTTNFRAERDKSKAEIALNNFISKYKNKFNMTITEELVQLAIRVDLANESSASETWLIRTATDYLRMFVKQGKSREDVIQKICGEINRKLRMNNPNPNAIENFATAVYDRLYIEDWKEKLPPINQEKIWIYQFAFLFAQASKLEKRRRKAIKIQRQLNEQNLELSEANVKKVLDKKLKKYANQYFETIKKL